MPSNYYTTKVLRNDLRYTIGWPASFFDGFLTLILAKKHFR